MTDQAARLRELVQNAESPLTNADDPHIVIVCGATGGLGATTLATQLAPAITEYFPEVLLADLNIYKNGINECLNLAAGNSESLTDVLDGCRTLAEVTQPGPKGIRLLLSNTDINRSHINAGSRDRLLREFRRHSGEDQVVIIDSGPGFTPWTEPFWQAAHTLFVVTTPEPRAVMSTFSMLQVAGRSGLLPAVKLIVNQCESEEIADDIHQQIGQPCYRQFNELLPPMPMLPILGNQERGASKSSEYQQAINALCRILAADFGLPERRFNSIAI